MEMDQLSILSDDELLLAFQSGDKRAYEVIYNRYWQILYRHARKMLQDETSAKDVVQEVFTVLWIRVAEVEIKPPLAAYLYSLTRNRILDLIKHSKVEVKYLQSLKDIMEVTAALPDSQYIERELFDQIEEEIRNLPEKMRVIFELSRKEYKSHKEIAEMLKLSDLTVKKQVSNAVQILKKKFGGSIHIFLIFF